MTKLMEWFQKYTQRIIEKIFCKLRIKYKRCPIHEMKRTIEGRKLLKVIVSIPICSEFARNEENERKKEQKFTVLIPV